MYRKIHRQLNLSEKKSLISRLVPNLGIEFCWEFALLSSLLRVM